MKKQSDALAVKAQDSEAVRKLARYTECGQFHGNDSRNLAEIRALIPKEGGQMKTDLERAEKTITERIQHEKRVWNLYAPRFRSAEK